MRFFMFMLGLNVVPLASIAGATVLAALGVEGWGWLMVITALTAKYPANVPSDVGPPRPAAPERRAPPAQPQRPRPPSGFQGRYQPPVRRE